MPALLHPRYWHWWLGVGILWSLTRLPLPWIWYIGRQIGHIAYWLARRRRRIAAINLKLCFPELNDQERHTLLCQHFVSLGIGLLELPYASWASDAALCPFGQVTGLEHLHAALARSKGVILLSAHFTSLDCGSRFLKIHTRLQGVYRPHENPVIDYFMTKGRKRHAEKVIPRGNTREMLRSLKQNKAVWFAMDQNFGHKNSVFAQFFGIPAATNTITARFAHISGAAVIPFFTQRLHDGRGYRGYQVTLQPPLDNFPSGDDVEDATRINRIIEQQIRQAPEQYLWVHRRFKDRPAGEKSVYIDI